MDRREQIRLIEAHLRSYKTYLIGMKNVQESLEEILPGMSNNYTCQECSNDTIKIKDKLDNVVLDRISSSRAIYLLEVLNTYKTIVHSIEDAVNALNDDEKELIRYRYFEGFSVEKTAQHLGCSTQNCFKIRVQALEKLLISLNNLQQMSVDL